MRNPVKLGKTRLERIESFEPTEMTEINEENSQNFQFKTGGIKQETVGAKRNRKKTEPTVKKSKEKKKRANLHIGRHQRLGRPICKFRISQATAPFVFAASLFALPRVPMEISNDRPYRVFFFTEFLSPTESYRL